MHHNIRHFLVDVLLKPVERRALADTFFTRYQQGIFISMIFLPGIQRFAQRLQQAGINHR